tara:strand:- start:270 stop:503 length:234 start_codon:yes stop_codon:yes gene_type:complete
MSTNLTGGDVKNIIIANYPGLKDILWDYHLPTISGEDAFYYYEKRLAYIGFDTLPVHEQLLLEKLTQTCGHGFLLAS